MCGILGTVNLPFDHSVLDLIQHRGPDDSGMQSFDVGESRVQFGHRRLSIIDLSEAGHQPMISACGNYAIIFNGEIYNHLDLREKLSDRNINFRGHSDTETILYYFKYFGINAVKDLNGIFSFSFLDFKEKKLYLARDPFGIKPLYYSHRENKLIFSSEMKTIIRLLPERKLNKENLYTFLRMRFSPSPQTLLEGVLKLEPGHFLELDLNNPRRINKEFYSYIPEKNISISETDATDIFDDLLHKAVKRQLLADVPIAILLSGGVDSALLTHLAQKVTGEKFSTYTVGFNTQSDANELEDARITSSLLKTNHHEVMINQEEFSQNLDRLVNMVEEPIGSQSIFPFYFLTQKIHVDGFKVALSGQGVDESWAGYKRYNFQQLFDSVAHPAFGTISSLASLTKNDKHRRALNVLAGKDRVHRFMESYSFFDQTMTGKLTNQLFGEKEQQILTGFIQEKFDLLRLNNHHAADSMMFMDARMNLSDDLLLYTDKISMQHSLELRVPFLDVELMKFVESLPVKFKVSLFANKKVYKKIAERHLPKEIIYRKKKGFYIPRKEWFRSDVGENFMNTIMSDSGAFSGIFNKKYIQKLFIDHRSGKKNYEDQLYSLLNIFFWMRKNLD